MQIRKLIIMLIYSFSFGENLEDLVNIAMENSYKLKNYEHIIISKKYVIEQAKDAYFPSLSLFSSASKDKYDQVYPFRTYNIDAQDIKYGAEIKQNIFNAKIFSAIKDAKLKEEVVKFEKDSFTLELYQDVIIAYFELLRDKENLNYYTLRKESFKKVLENIEEKAKYKYSTATDLSQAQSNYSIAENDYIKAKLRYENSVKKLQILLNTSDISFDVNKKISNNLDEIIKTLVLPYESYKSKLENNPTIKSATLYTKIAKNEIDNRKYERYPTLTLNATYYDTDSQDDSTYEKNRFRTTLNLNIDLYKGGAISDRISEAQELYIAAKYDYEDKKHLLELDFNKNWDNLQSSLKIVNSDKDNIAKTSEYLKKAEESFKYKLISLSDYYTAQNDYFQSLINLKNDNLNLIYYYISLLAKTSELKEKVKELESFID